ncbi:MAG: hypothetical protein WHX52_13585 [Anaerolineae bacterium]
MTKARLAENCKQVAHQRCQAIKWTGVFLIILLTLLPVFRTTLIVLTTGANNLSNDYLRFTYLIGRILDGGYNWQNYFRDTFWNGHSLALPVLVYLAVAKFAHWNVYVEMCVGIVMGIVRLALLYDAFVHAKGQKINWVLWPMLSALIFSVSQMNVFTFGFTNIHMMLNQLGVALGVWGLARFPNRWVGVLCVSCGGIIAALSWGVGVMAWPALSIGLLLAQFRRGAHYGVWTLSGALAALPYIVFMFLQPTPAAVKSFTVVSWFNTSFILNALGRPFVNGIGMNVGPILLAELSGGGGIILVVVGVLLLRAAKSKTQWMKAAPAIALIVYSLLSIWQASVFRNNVAPWYTTPAMSFWIGLLGLVYVIWNSRQVTESAFYRLKTIYGFGIVIAVGCLYVGANVSYEDKVFHLFSRSPASAACLRNYRTAPTYCEGYLFQWGVGQSGIVSLLGKVLERHNLSVFAPRQRWTLQGDFVLDTVRVAKTPGVPDTFWSTGMTASPVSWAHYQHLNLFLHAPNTVEWTVTLPPNTKRATFYSAVATGKLTSAGGITFEVAILPAGENRELAFSHYVAATRRWQPFQLSLDQYAGSTITIEIASHSEDSTGGWGVYRYPYIEVVLHPDSPIEEVIVAPSNTDVGTSVTLTASDFRFDVTNARLWDVTGMTPVPGQQAVWEVVAHDPNLRYTPPFSICLFDYTHIYVKMAASPDITPRALQVYYLLDGQSAFHEAQSLTIPLLADGESHAYTYDFKLLALPQQTYLTGIRLDPVYSVTSTGDSHVQIEDIRLIHGQNTESFCPNAMSSIQLPGLQLFGN